MSAFDEAMDESEELRDESFDCALCQSPCTTDHYCYGCNSYVCSDCERNYTLAGPHDPDAHSIEVEDPDEEIEFEE